MESEIIFLVERAPEGGYTARALGYSIFTEADTWDELKTATQDAVRVHFDEENKPAILRLHIVPRHKALRIGTLSGILNDVAAHLKMDRDSLAKSLFEK